MAVADSADTAVADSEEDTAAVAAADIADEPAGHRTSLAQSCNVIFDAHPSTRA
jgi:hypothetical protein